MVDQREILQKWILNRNEWQWKYIFYESKYQGVKNFVEEMANADAIVILSADEDKSIQRKTDGTDQRIGSGEKQVIVSETALTQSGATDTKLEKDEKLYLTKGTDSNWILSVKGEKHNGLMEWSVKGVHPANEFMKFACLLPDEKTYRANLFKSWDTWSKDFLERWDTRTTQQKLQFKTDTTESYEN